MEPLKRISQKPRVHPFGTDFFIKKSMKVFSSILYYKQGSLQKDLADRCLHTALNPFLVGFFRAVF